MSPDASDFEFRGSAARVAQLAHNRLPVAEFYHYFLDSLPTPPGTLGAVAWVCGADTFSKLAVSSRSLSTGIQLPYSSDEHARQLHEVRLARQPRIFDPPPQADYQIVVENALPMLAVFPIVVEEVVPVVVEVFLPPDLPQDTTQAWVSHVGILCEVAATFHGATQGPNDGSSSSTGLALAIHRTLRVKDTCFAVANEGRHEIGCDRVAVLTRRGEKYIARAVSGQESVNRRANLIQTLERLVGRVLSTGEPFWHPAEQGIAPQIQEALETFLEVSHSRHVGILPLGTESIDADEDAIEHVGQRISEPVGALVVEQFTDVDVGRGAIEQRASSVADAASIALQNATDHERILLLPFWRAMSDAVHFVSGKRRWKALAIAGVVTAAVLALLLIPAELEMACEGKLLPVERQKRFAGIDGTVDQLHVQHGSRVQTGTLLVTLRNSELDLALQQTLGEIRKAQLRLDAVRAGRFGTRLPEADTSPTDAHAAAAEEEDLKALLESLQKQLEIHRARRELLQLQSTQDGEVITYDLEDRLQDRPVLRGQLLLEVARLDGPWCLELNLPDRRVAHVFAAQQQSTKPLPVTFIVSSQPGITYTGKVTETARATRVDPEIGQNVLVTVAVDDENVAFRQPGTGIQAKIQCGRRSLGYVWLHGALEFIQSQVLFRFF